MQYIGKLLFIAVFTAILYAVIEIFLHLIKLELAKISVLADVNFMLCYLGIYAALNLMFSILVAVWVVDHLIKFWRN